LLGSRWPLGTVVKETTAVATKSNPNATRNNLGASLVRCIIVLASLSSRIHHKAYGIRFGFSHHSTTQHKTTLKNVQQNWE
jgi:hypothetical protein